MTSTTTVVQDTLKEVREKYKHVPTVATKQGVLTGTVVENQFSDGKYYSFLGIPYAQPPIGDLRFQAPLAPKPWAGVFQATTEQPGCYARHPIYNNILGSEDCLYLNVFTPEFPSANIEHTQKPVMVYVHGGSFIQGSGTTELYGPEFLVLEDVVIVTFNYRVGLLGFLSLNDPSLGVPGNAGLKDIVMALRWINENISSFGGDPQNITLFGCSAGAASIHYLIASPMGKDLFHRVILQSGSLFCPWALSVGYREKLKEVFNTTSESEILNILRKMPVEEVHSIQEKMGDDYGEYNQKMHGPVIENKNSMEEAFLTEDPLEIINSGEYNHVPIIIGYSNREGLIYALFNKLSDGTIRQPSGFEKLIPPCLKCANGTPESKNVTTSIKSFYYGDEEPSMNASEHTSYIDTQNIFDRMVTPGVGVKLFSTPLRIVPMIGDSHFLTGTIYAIRAHLRTSTSPIFLYRFSVDGRLNLYKRTSNLNFFGACHADELGYLFKGILSSNLYRNSIEDNCRRRLTKLWTNFAKFGDPNTLDCDPPLNVSWNRVTLDEMNFLEIGENLTVGKDPDCTRMNFWNEIYKSHGASQYCY